MKDSEKDEYSDTDFTDHVVARGGVAYGVWVNVLFTMGIILFMIVMTMSIISEILKRRSRLKFEGKL